MCVFKGVDVTSGVLMLQQAGDEIPLAVKSATTGPGAYFETRSRNVLS